MRSTLGTILLILTTASISHADLISNGSFELGNTGFGSDLQYDPTPPFTNFDGQYAIGTNPSHWFPGWANIGDHTTGTGLMLIATPLPGNARIWFQSVTVAANTDYEFQGWAAHVTSNNPAILSVNVDNQSIGILNLADHSPATWIGFNFSFSSSVAGPIELSITDLNPGGSGNDFALDDLSFTAVPEPGSLLLVSSAAFVLTLNTRRRRMSLLT